MGKNTPEYNKMYYEKNKAQIVLKATERIACDCGKTYLFSHKARHLKSSLHIRYLELKNKPKCVCTCPTCGHVSTH